MARKTILVSDLSGRESNEGEAAKVTITYADARRGQVVLDVNAFGGRGACEQGHAAGAARAPQAARLREQPAAARDEYDLARRAFVTWRRRRGRT